MYKKVRVVGVILVTLSLLTGCFRFGKVNVESLPLVPSLSEKEIIDYYKEALEFDAIVSRNIDIKEVSYETRPVEEDGEMEDILKNITRRVEGILKRMQYSDSDRDLIDESIFHYIKASLDDRKLVDGKIVRMEEALGHYFVDIDYNIYPRTIGYAKPQSTLIGLHGAFTRNYLDEDFVDNTYVKKGIETLNKYYVENNINKYLVYHEEEERISASGDAIIDFTKTIIEDIDYTKNKDRLIRTTIDPDEADGEIDESHVEAAEDILEVGESDVEAIDDEENIEEGQESVGTHDIDRINRFPVLNTREFNNIAGSSLTQSAYIPNLEMIYAIPSSDGTIGGMGIYPSGVGGLRRFGYDRSEIRGNIRLRYVFKSNIGDPKDLKVSNIYIIESNLVFDVGEDIDPVIIPEFLEEELEKLLERSDRALINNDVVALTSGDIYSDIGMAILNGYRLRYINTSRYISKLRRVVMRDVINNAYLLEVDNILQEGAKNADTYAVYRDVNYIAVEQVGDKFVITDFINASRAMNKEPTINPDSAIIKRLAALNLAGEVPEKSKEDIGVLLNDLYTASTHRVLRGQSEVTVGDKVTMLEKGMYDCFNSDTSLLADTKKEYMNATLRELLVRQGVDTKATYNGVITEWIGGANNQAELITEEIIEYKGKNKGHYLQTYYLVSNINGDWVIDDMKIIESEDKTGEALKQVINRIVGE